MRVTVDLPDELGRRAQAAAALRGGTLEELAADAVRASVDGLGQPSGVRGWRAVFGKASPLDVAAVQAVIDSEFSKRR